MARSINIDKTELVVTFLAGKRYKVLNLSYEDIQRIQFDPIEIRKLFKKIPAEKISIFSSKTQDPIVITKTKDDAKVWDEYKKKLPDFAERHHVTFTDNTA